MKETYGFELMRDVQIPELNSRARLYRHIQTGAELLSMENKDENKVFGITFRTPPPDSSGVAHIMEHSVLCGSRKYPVKEPFAELMKSSLKTFLNAMTYPDKTVYPVASTNLQDFYNLVDVYLDAVFYPLISPYTFEQEGWHYEAENPEAPLSYKGVVFNEMKGVYSSPDSLLDDHSQRSLYPNTIYGFDSGGDPSVIPTLTYEAFRNFHDTYYHPSNSRIFFWGDDDPEKRLEFLDEWLKQFEPIPVRSQIPLQPQFNSPQRWVRQYDPGEEGENAKAMITINWMLTDPFDAERTIGMNILQQILIGNPASPLRKTLIESGLGEDLTGRGLDEGMRQMMFSTGLKGVLPEHLQQVEMLILDTLEGLAADGIDKATVEAALNTIEFLLREQNTGSYPRGLFNMINSLTTWLYDGDPLALLAFEKPLQSIKEQVAAGKPYFENMIRSLLLSNPHRTTVILMPEAGYAEKVAADEQKRLEEARSLMGPEDLQIVIADTEELHRRQEAPDDPLLLQTIPTLDLSDLDPKSKTIPIEVLKAGDSRVLFHDLFTNGIVYLDAGFDLHNLPTQYLPYVSVFSRALLETGTDKESFVELLQRIGRSTGGIHPAAFASPVAGQAQSEAWLFLRGKSTTAQAGELLSILRDVLSGARLEDRERIRQIALEEKAGIESSVVMGGHRFINMRLRSKFDEAGWANEQMDGIAQLFFLRDLIRRIDEDWDAVYQNLITIRSLLFNRSNSLINVTTDAESFASLRPQVEDFLAALPQTDVISAEWELGDREQNEGLALPAQVNFVGQGMNLYDAGYQLDGSVFVIVPQLRSSYLWDRVRVQGGAYGAFDIFERNSGVFTFVSYRDPNLVRTLDVYRQAADHLKSLELTEDDRTRAIIAAIGEIDQYQLPDAKGWTSMMRYLVGITDEERQHLRDQVLSTTIEDFHRFGEVLERATKDRVVVVLGSQEKIQQANEQLEQKLPIKKIL